MIGGHTPGPWAWFGNVDTKTLYLATVHHGRRFVMQFGRYGMQGAKPVFQKDQRMVGADEMVVFEVCREAESRDDERVYRGDIVDIDHPDALLIKSAPDLMEAASAITRAWSFGTSPTAKEREALMAAVHKARRR